MLKVLLWFVSDYKNFFQDAVTLLKVQYGGIEILGSIGRNEIIKVDCNKADIILVVGAKKFGMGQIIKEVRRLNLPAEKLLGDWIVCIPGFTLKKYRLLQRSHLSIFSVNCFGGFISHLLGLPFQSPFINMFLNARDYLRFLREPQAYMAKNLVLKEMQWNANLKFNYPVVKLGDIKLNMNHYRSFDEVVKSWERRKARINWDNLFVTMHTEDEKILQEFDSLPYEKKACFVSFKSDLPSAWYINPELRKDLPFWGIIVRFAQGSPLCYGPFDMLLYGKKTPLIDM